MTIKPGFAAIAAKYGPEVENWIRSSPQRAYEFFVAYGPQGENNRQHGQEEAEHARMEAERRVARAAMDTTYALEWAQRVVRSNEMQQPFAKLSFREKVDAVQQQEYEDELDTYLRTLPLLTEKAEPAARTFPARNRAWHEAVRVYESTIGPYRYVPRKRIGVADIPLAGEVVAEVAEAHSQSDSRKMRVGGSE